MITKFIRKYFAIIFLLASFSTTLHHHDDTLTHEDCQICIVQSNIFSADIPSNPLYLSHIEIKAESILSKLFSLHLDILYKEHHSRAPPSFS